METQWALALYSQLSPAVVRRALSPHLPTPVFRLQAGICYSSLTDLLRRMPAGFVLVATHLSLATGLTFPVSPCPVCNRLQKK